MNSRLITSPLPASRLAENGDAEASRWLTGAFIMEVCRNPRAVGAIAPTGNDIAMALISTANVKGSQRIIELGAGTGAITKHIVKDTSAESDVLAIEKNPKFSAILRASFPSLKVRCGCVTRLSQFAAQAGFKDAESIISALPWTVFPLPVQEEVIGTVASLLTENGVFTTVACYGIHLTRAGRNFRTLLDDKFAKVHATPVVWRNFPPAFIYRCSK